MYRLKTTINAASTEYGSTYEKNILTVNKFKEQLKSGDIHPNHWEVVELHEERYLLMIRNYQNLYSGYWIPLDTLTSNFGLEEGTLLGEVYVMDRDFDNTIMEKEINAVLKEKGSDIHKIKIEGQRYSNYTVTTQNGDVTFGIWVPWLSVFYNIPLFNKLIFIIDDRSTSTINIFYSQKSLEQRFFRLEMEHILLKNSSHLFNRLFTFFFSFHIFR